MFRIVLLTRTRALAVFPDVPIARETPTFVSFHTMTVEEEGFRRVSWPLGEALYRNGADDRLPLPEESYPDIAAMEADVRARLRWVQPCHAFADRTGK